MLRSLMSPRKSSGHRQTCAWPLCPSPLRRADQRKGDDGQAVAPAPTAAAPAPPGEAVQQQQQEHNVPCLCSNRGGGGGGTAQRPAGSPAEGAGAAAARQLAAAREAGDNATLHTFVGHMRRLHRCRLVVQVGERGRSSGALFVPARVAELAEETHRVFGPFESCVQQRGGLRHRQWPLTA
jgi:hypothetical protein